MDQQIEMIWEYCAANRIKFTFEFDDEKIEFTFPSDPNRTARQSRLEPAYNRKAWIPAYSLAQI